MAVLSFKIKHYDGQEYIFFPACCYNGNRFKSLKKPYSPRFTPEDSGIDMPITITDVPRLAPDGSGAVEVTTGDVSVPCMGMFSASRKTGMLIFTVQQMQGENLGLSFSGGTFSITFPAVRHNIYVWPFMQENTQVKDTQAKAADVVIPYRVLEFACEDMQQFFRTFFNHRKIMGLDCTRAKNSSYRQQWDIQRQKFNAMNYVPGWGYISVTDHSYFAPGWCGTGMSSYVFMKLGDAAEWKRAAETLDFIFNMQTESGFFPGSVDKTGTPHGDTGKGLLVRKAADVLYFLFKHFDVYQEKGLEIPDTYIQGTRRLADAFCRLFDRYGQLGQFVDYKTGELLIGNSTSGALAPAGLARAYAFFDDAKYLQTAEQIAEQYYSRDLCRGYTTGGPGDILQGPDSESAFALLESMVVLYETTRQEKWLHYAEFAAVFCSSWVVAYNYRFPADREYYRLGIKTTGTVFANVQNKHSAPGICTLSGDSLYKLYQYTKNEAYLELLRDICSAISQCMSTEERPIHSWTVPKDPTLHPGAAPVPSEKLPAGFICERVNMSDWETEKCIGGVFNGSCWCEVSNLLKLAEIPEDL